MTCVEGHPKLLAESGKWMEAGGFDRADGYMNDDFNLI